MKRRSNAKGELFRKYSSLTGECPSSRSGIGAHIPANVSFLGRDGPIRAPPRCIGAMVRRAKEGVPVSRNPFLVRNVADQAKAAVMRRRRMAAPTSAKPPIIIAQPAGSGMPPTVVEPKVKSSNICWLAVPPNTTDRAMPAKSR